MTATSAPLWANNDATTLASGITTGAVSLTVVSGTGALFPAITTGQFFALTLINQLSSTTFEIVWVTARSGDTMTVIRAQEGTTAKAFNAGDFAQGLITAGGLGQLAPLYSPQFGGEPTITDATTNSNQSLTVTATSNVQGAAIKLTGNGATTPSKWLRVVGGVFQIINNAFNSAILTLSDAGAMVIQGAFTAVGNIATSGGSISAAGNISAAAEVTAGTNVIATADVIANYVQGVNVTASGGFLAASQGARNGGASASTGVILNDFLSASFGTNGFQVWPNGLIFQWGNLVVPNTGPNQAVGLSITYPNAHLWAGASFGAAPTAENFVGAAPDGPSNIAIGLIATVTNNTIFWWSIGF